MYLSLSSQIVQVLKKIQKTSNVMGVTKRRKRKTERKRNGENCSDRLIFYLKYYTLNKNTLYSIKACEDIFTTTEIVLVLLH